LASYPGLVVLDDLGREKVTDWTGEVVYTLVNGRYEAMLPTVVTTNLTRSDLAESAYWPAISRLAEDGALVAIEAEDRRLRRVSWAALPGSGRWPPPLARNRPRAATAPP
jgi:DNA replication protein DnaC